MIQPEVTFEQHPTYVDGLFIGIRWICINWKTHRVASGVAKDWDMAEIEIRAGLSGVKAA